MSFYHNFISSSSSRSSSSGIVEAWPHSYELFNMMFHHMVLFII